MLLRIYSILLARFPHAFFSHFNFTLLVVLVLQVANRSGPESMMASVSYHSRPCSDERRIWRGQPPTAVTCCWPADSVLRNVGGGGKKNAPQKAPFFCPRTAGRKRRSVGNLVEAERHLASLQLLWPTLNALSRP